MIVVRVNAAIEESGKLSTNVTRKVIHIFVAPIGLVAYMLFSGGIFSRWLALLVPVMFALLFLAIGTGKIVNEDFVKSMSRSGDPRELLGGTLYYVLMFCVVTILWFYVPVTGIAGATPAAVVIFGCVAGGDGLAGMFIGSFLFSYVLTFIYSLEVGFDMVALLIPILVISLIATIVEALTPKGLDNWTVPIAVIVLILLFFTFVPVWWPFPLFTL
jgi:hypothetical protein